MTTEEKAREISDIYMPDTGFNRSDLYDAAIEMAEWKEQQMIDKTCEWLELHMQCGVHPQNVSSTIKQFKKAMK